MKTTISVLSILFFVALGLQHIEAQNPKSKQTTAIISVPGVCELCKKKIESAAMIKGVKLATWNKDKKQLKVIYQSDKTDVQKISQSIATIGYDTEMVKATDESYTKLPDCCKYRSGIESH